MTNNSSFTEFLVELMADENLYLLLDRSHEPTLRSRLSFAARGSERAKSLLQYQQLCIDMARYWHDYHLDNETRYLQFRSAPHTWEKYIGARVAEFLNIPSFVTLESRIPGYVFLGRSVGRTPKLIEVPHDMRDNKYAERASDYIRRSSLDYRDVIPQYESDRLQRNRGRYYSFRSHLRQHWTRPGYVLNSWQCWRQLRSLSTPFEELKDKKYVVIFPHYQPERTSVPQAYGYAQQELMILAVREALPANVRVIVKEHPSTFTNQCPTIARWPSWYRSISDIEGVSFVDIATDTFQLIDNAIATVTLSGTVATESLLRGIPSVIFGILKWTPTYGQYHFASHTGLVSFLESAIKGKLRPDDIRAETQKTILDIESSFAISALRPWPSIRREQRTIIDQI
jgi:hypothetical protein